MMLHTMHRLKMKAISHKSLWKVLRYHVFGASSPSGWTNKAYLKAGHLIAAQFQMDVL